VTEQDLLAFGAALRCATLAKKPEETWRATVWTWNKAQRSVPGWPAIALETSKREPIYLPWSAFPPALKADVDAYLDHLAGRDLAEDGPPPASPSTLDLRERQLRIFASLLVQAGRTPENLMSVADLVTLDAFKAGLRVLLEKRGGEKSSTIENLARFLKSVARHKGKADAETLNKMGAIIKKYMGVGRRGLTAKNRERLRQFDDPRNVIALLLLPQLLMRIAEAKKLPPRLCALAAQTAVAIEILLMAPLRIDNLVGLDIERHLIRTGGGLQIVVAEHEVKNDVELHHPLPDESTAIIQCYITEFRPLLASVGSSMLFPGQGGIKPKAQSSMRQQITRAIARHTGLKMHPHLFRHATTKIFLDKHPGQYEVVRQVLGHKSLETTTRFYAGGEGVAANRHFDAVILGIRRNHAKKPP
jgi:site-specific recombinase XerD